MRCLGDTSPHLGCRESFPGVFEIRSGRWQEPEIGMGCGWNPGEKGQDEAWRSQAALSSSEPAPMRLTRENSEGLSPGPLWGAAHGWPELRRVHSREGLSFSADQLVMLQGWGAGVQVCSGLRTAV